MDDKIHNAEGKKNNNNKKANISREQLELATNNLRSPKRGASFALL